MCHPDTYCEKKFRERQGIMRAVGLEPTNQKGPGLKSGAFDHSAIHALILVFL